MRAPNGAFRSCTNGLFDFRIKVLARRHGDIAFLRVVPMKSEAWNMSILLALIATLVIVEMPTRPWVMCSALSFPPPLNSGMI
jgi:hypothetical protein